MRAIDAAGFERKFRKTIDPWNYASSRFERYKRGVLLRACGPSRRGRVLELGCAIGETTRSLARMSLRPAATWLFLIIAARSTMPRCRRSLRTADCAGTLPAT